MPLDEQYRRWRARAEPDRRDLRRLAGEAVTGKPKVSILFLVAPSPEDPGAIDLTLRSLQEQPYPWWRAAVVADPGLPRAWAGEERILCAAAQPDVHWSEVLLQAAHPEPGEHVGLLSPGSRLTPHGLLALARALMSAPDRDLVYTDWDEIDGRGQRSDPHLAYGWSPELLMGCDYMGGLVLQRFGLLKAAGGWRREDAPVEVYAQLLRTAQHARHPEHVAVVAVSRRPGAVGEASSADRWTALVRWLAATSPGAQVETGREAGVTDVRFAVRGEADVDIVIPTRDRPDLLRRCLASVEASSYRHHRVVVVDNDSAEEESREYLSQLPRVVSHPGAFNFSAIVNDGVAATHAPYVVLLNNDTVARSSGWLEALLGWCQRPGVGAVGARLLFADGRVQHEGIGIGIGRVAANLDLGWSASRACSAVTGACMMVRREAWDAVGGFDEALPVAFNDIDFCLRLWEAGWRVVMTPLAELQHDEGSSRGDRVAEVDYRRFCARWGDEERLRDAFLGPHVAWPRPLTLRIPPRRSRVRRS